MSENDLFYRGEGDEKNYRFLRQGGSIDFFRAYRKRTPALTNASLPADAERRRVILQVFGKLERLVDEYTVTARRVDTPLDVGILRRVVDALQRESLGDPAPLDGLQASNATEQFLAESLYGELLEVPVLIPQLESGEGCNFLSSGDWRCCLDLLAKSILTHSTSNPYAN